jgi:type IV fimbrial biogenesis protein FimT
MKGFTLVEMLVTVALVAILATVAVPSFAELIRNGRATAQTNELIGSLHLARSEAITRAEPVVLCASSSGTACTGAASWSDGWMVFVDRGGAVGSFDPASDEALRIYPALGGDSRLSSASGFLRYRPDGTLDAVAAVEFTLRQPVCHSGTPRDIRVSPVGRPAVSKPACA